jgi:four helix bundle protein
MATYNELEVFKTSYDLTLHLFRFTEKMQRTFKYTIGERLCNHSIEMLLNVYRANSYKNDRIDHLQNAQVNVEEIRLLMRISKDLEILPIKRFAVLSEMVESISKQVYKWKEATIHALPAYIKEQMNRPKAPNPVQNKLF